MSVLTNQEVEETGTRESGQDQEPRYCWVKEGYFKVSRSLSCCSTIKKKKKKLKAEPEFLGPAIRKSLVRVVLFELKVRV